MTAHIVTRKRPPTINEAFDELVQALEQVDDLLVLRQGLGISIALLVASDDPQIQNGAPVYGALEGLAKAVQVRREARD